MFDLESNKEMCERFMCVDCMKDNPKKYKTIEDLNEQWATFNSEQDKVLQKLKKKKLDLSFKQQIQITEMRKTYNQQLNDLEDTLVKEQIKSNNQINEIKKKNHCKTINELNNEDLIEAMQILTKVEKASALITRLIEYQIGKDQIFNQDIENKLEKLKQHSILDIQYLQMSQEIKTIVMSQNSSLKWQRNQQNSNKVINQIKQFWIRLIKIQMISYEFQNNMNAILINSKLLLSFLKNSILKQNHLEINY